MFNLFKKKPQGESLTLKIKGMHCTSCSMNIDGELEDLDGVFKAETSYAQSTTKVEFDSTKVTRDSIVGVITDLGYTVE
jgi:copper chaperone CopZ